jgi:hypothetical protein
VPSPSPIIRGGGTLGKQDDWVTAAQQTRLLELQKEPRHRRHHRTEVVSDLLNNEQFGLVHADLEAFATSDPIPHLRGRHLARDLLPTLIAVMLSRQCERLLEHARFELA